MVDDRHENDDRPDRESTPPEPDEFAPEMPAERPEGTHGEPDSRDEELPPPPWTDEARAARDEAPAAHRVPRAATIVAYGVVVLALLGVVMTAFAVRLYLREQRTLEVLDASVDRIAAAYAGPGADDDARRRVAWLRRSISEGDYAQAQKALAMLERPATAPAAAPEPQVPGADGELPRPQGQPPDPMEARDLPAEARAFFADNTELWKSFFGFSVALLRLERGGVRTDDLKTLRASMIEAARLGNVERVEELLGDARETLQRLSGEALPDTLQDKLKVFTRAFGRAREQGRDVRRAADLARQSEEAARAGEFKRAEELLDDAIAALRRAPRGRPRPPQFARRGRGAPPGLDVAFLNFVTQLFSNVLKSEERDLTVIWESVNNAAVAIREHNADQVREILGNAVDALRTIGARRREMSRAIEAAQEQRRAARSPRARPPAEQQRAKVVMERIGAILTRVRELSAEEYEAAREKIARDLIAAVTAPIEETAPSMQPGREPTAEERVRMKMRIAGEVYAEVKRRGLPTEDLTERFAEARRLIAEGEYEQAEKLADEAVATMRALVREDAPAATGDGPDVIELEDGTTIDLRGIVGGEPIVAPPPAVTPDEPVIFEEARQ